MRVQAFLTAMTVNLKRLAAALDLFLAALFDLLTGRPVGAKPNTSGFRELPNTRPSRKRRGRPSAPPQIEYFISPRVHWMRNAQSYVPKGQQSMVAAALRQAFIQPDRRAMLEIG